MYPDIEKTQAPQDRSLFEKELAYRLRQQNEAKCAGTSNECAHTLMTEAETLAELFKYHSPNEVTIPKFTAINQAAKNFAEVVLQNCPRGADRATVIACIRNARMFANAAISLNGLSL